MGKYMRTALGLMLSGILLAATAQADEQQANELRERANALKEKVQRLHEEGKHDDAQRLEREVGDLFAKADQVAGEGPRDPGVREAVTRKLHDLYREWIEAVEGGRPDAAEDLQRKIHEVTRDMGARMHELLKPQLEMMERKIEELRQQGKPELADRLANQMRELIQAHRRAQAEQQSAERQPGPDPGRQQRIQELERRLEEVRRQGNQPEAEGVLRELEQLRQMRDMAPGERGPGERGPGQRGPGEQGPDGQPGPGPQDRGEQERRMQHLRVAADNLDAIGMQDMAQRLRNQAEEIQRRLENPQQGPEDLRNEVRRLHERVNELNRRLDELTEMLRRPSN